MKALPIRTAGRHDMVASLPPTWSVRGVREEHLTGLAPTWSRTLRGQEANYAGSQWRRVCQAKREGQAQAADGCETKPDRTTGQEARGEGTQATVGKHVYKTQDRVIL